MARSGEGYNILDELLNPTRSKNFFFSVLRFELGAYTLSHSTTPFLGRVFSK
jgi:hypothetical protein